MKGKDIHVSFSPEALATYHDLQKKALEQKKKGIENSSEVQLLNSIDREKTNLSINPQKGAHIPRRVISKGVVNRYNTDKLWKLDLVGYWRLIYTITGDDVKIIAFVLEIMDHKKYDKVFGYEKI